ncbi:hypothetical protein D3C76_941280 [compost metagenome]
MGRHLDLGEDFSYFHQVQITGWRHLQASANPAKQQVLQQLFQLRHLFTDGALGQVQLFRGPGEAQVAGHGFETLQRSDRGQIAFVQHGRSFLLVSLLPAMHSMNKRNDISLNGRLLSNLGSAKTTGLISRDSAAAHVPFFA